MHLNRLGENVHANKFGFVVGRGVPVVPFCDLGCLAGCRGGGVGAGGGWVGGPDCRCVVGWVGGGGGHPSFGSFPIFRGAGCCCWPPVLHHPWRVAWF